MGDLILFLDIDGVLHPWHREPRLLYRSVPIFEEALRAHPNIEIVISSDRRIHESLEDLRKPFSRDIQARIIDVNPFFDGFTELEKSLFPSDLLNHPRQLECLAWLATHRPGDDSSWVAIDDTFDHFHPLQSNIYWVEGTTGLESSELDQLRDFLAEEYLR
ncbi:HAD domain-containing protein [Polaromonas sp. YR568]|uniref:HAD domain-containing protein n=1 Tax=Polaromonas sp. YR568 TaxID=1855301 RepID=UPI00398BC0C3